MNRFALITAVVTGMVVGAGPCLADDNGDSSQIKLRPSGFASMYLGEIVNGGVNSATNMPMNGTWMNQMIAHLSVNASLGNRNSLGLGMEMQMYNDFPIASLYTYRYQYFNQYFTEAEYTHAFGDAGNPYLSFTAGYFPFKYDPDAMNLGEYLFRTGTYPEYINLNDDIDFPLARLMGFHAAFHPLPNLTVDGLCYTNLVLYAIGDWNLAGIVTWDPFKGIELGLGGSLNSFFSADTLLTTPHNPETAYHITYNEATGQADTSFYTYKGAKMMARASIDLKQFIGENGLGKEDLKLFGEAAILGLKNYPENLNGGINYDTLANRIPVTMGLNLPVFKLLDILSLQAEWFGSPYANDIGAMTESELPLPGPYTYSGVGMPDSLAGRPTSAASSHWKWSIYGSRHFAQNYTVTFQVASDHLRPVPAPYEDNADYNEICHNINQWYYMLKLTAGF